jgi:predicted RND superfamily exporter protein
MASIVIGNGINFGIILLARFMEERRKRKEAPRSLYIAIQKTISATAVLYCCTARSVIPFSE